MPQISKSQALIALANEGLIAVEHPTGPVQAPGGGRTDWAAVAGTFLCPGPATPSIYDVVSLVRTWNQRVGCFVPRSWHPTMISILDAVSGHVVATCELNDEAALIDAVLTVVSRRRRG